ncbi:hypothetical protein ACFQ3Z_03995 [Streptomyces nogalater]
MAIATPLGFGLRATAWAAGNGALVSAVALGVLLVACCGRRAAGRPCVWSTAGCR